MTILLAPPAVSSKVRRVESCTSDDGNESSNSSRGGAGTTRLRRPLHDNTESDDGASSVKSSPSFTVSRDAITTTTVTTSPITEGRQQQPQPKRRVHFSSKYSSSNNNNNNNNDNEIDTEVIPYTIYGCELPCHDDDSGEMQEPEPTWFTNHEMLSIQKQALSVADFCLDFRAEYNATAMKLLSKCADSTNHLDDEDEDNHDNKHRLSIDTFPSITAFVGGSARGLEQTVVPILQQRRLQTVKSALQTQERLKKLPADQRWHLMALQYKRNSRYAAIWSRIMAEGDSILCGEIVG